MCKCCYSGTAKCCLFFVNIIFFKLGMALIILGLILRYIKIIYEPFLQTGIDLMQKIITDTPLADFDTDGIDLGSLVQALAIGIIVGGIFICAVSFLGCCGARYNIDCLLWLYIIVVVLFTIGEVIMIGIMYGNPSIVKDGIKEASMPKYEGLDSSEPLSFGWNVVMIQFQCCGVESYWDFDVSLSWNRTASGSKSINPPLVTPIACCKKLPNKDDLKLDCAQVPFKEDINNGKIGCYDTIWDLSFGKTAIAVPVLVVCGVLQVTLFLLAGVILRSEDKENGCL